MFTEEALFPEESVECNGEDLVEISAEELLTLTSNLASDKVEVKCAEVVLKVEFGPGGLVEFAADVLVKFGVRRYPSGK